MRISFLFTISLALILIACKSPTTSSTSANEIAEEVIELLTVDENHPNKKQMEWMLNNYKEPFMIGEHPSHMLEDSLILAQEYFSIYQSDLSLLLIFCTHQTDALTLGETYFSSTEGNQKYGVNGAVLFVVSGTNTYEVNDVLSLFAGEE